MHCECEPNVHRVPQRTYRPLKNNQSKHNKRKHTQKNYSVHSCKAFTQNKNKQKKDNAYSKYCHFIICMLEKQMLLAVDTMGLLFVVLNAACVFAVDFGLFAFQFFFLSL